LRALRLRLTLGLLLLPTLALSQAPTFNILSRMSIVKSRFGMGTIFSIDVDQREYWITAKHVLNGVEHPPFGSMVEKSVQLQVLDPTANEEKWLSVNFKVIDPGKDIDIVVLAAPATLLPNPVDSAAVSSVGVVLGGECEFLGFPYGGGWQAKFGNDTRYWMPYIKHCYVSGLPDGPIRVWVLDGINNKGFSGGPVVFGTGADQKIMAVVSSYRTEPAEVVASLVPEKSASTPKPKPPQVNVNSGFMIAFDMSPAIDAIHSNPVGPLRTKK
jgi:hypothetical protein